MQGKANSTTVAGALRSAPRRAIVTFLMAVFSVFAGIGVAGDIMNMGRQPLLRFELNVVLTGLFAVGYAWTGIELRKQFWKAAVPLFAAQFLISAVLGARMPDRPQSALMSAAEWARLQSRLQFDGCATIIAVCLGYTGFVYVFVSEGRRYVRTQTEKAALEGEMSAARQVQQVILPGHNEHFPGFIVESAYRPAEEVGGDFFQIVSAPNEGLLLVVGDVAGKGLPAAMLVSMIVGSVRTAAEDSHDPAVLLRRLHELLMGRTSGGFCTALAAHITASGSVTLANAGHLPPYLDGQEIEMPGALPLGIAAVAAYEVTRFELHRASRLTFYSDGVVEAQGPDGELFGFERAKAIATEPAEDIAAAAVRFGQADDITVVTIARAARDREPAQEMQWS